MEKEIFGANAAPLRQPRLGRAPEALNAIDVDASTPDKHAVAMFDPEVFAVAEVDQAVIADPAIRVNDARQGNTPANNRSPCGLFRIGHDLGVDAPLALENAEDDGLS